jgi:uncharacterized protein YndB with AHSA1/START domain
MVRALFFAFWMFAIVAPGDQLEQLARSGNIQENAPVKASVSVEIDAPPEHVWHLLTAIDDWPEWQTDIGSAKLDGPLQSGTSFTWSAGMSTHSRLALVKPPEEIAWTGTAFGANAVHVWKLHRLPGNRTLVKTDESMDGFLTWFYSSKKLEESDRRWLSNLKAASEK